MDRKAKPDLTEEEILERLAAARPGKGLLTTRDLQKVFGGVHRVTIYKYVQAGLRHATVRGTGKASVYRREDVASFVQRKFAPVPAGASGNGPAATGRRPRDDRDEGGRASGDARKPPGGSRTRQK